MVSELYLQIRVAIGADHGGFEMKEALKKDLAELGCEVIDVGTYSKDAVDYPDFALAVAQQVSSGQAWRGVVIDGAGIGSCMVANKVPGVRAAMAYDHASASNSREHNDANVLTLGAGMIGHEPCETNTENLADDRFGGGRHAKRVDKIIQIEKQF
jgi:ribose 5-phosphate isomerase B